MYITHIFDVFSLEVVKELKKKEQLNNNNKPLHVEVCPNWLTTGCACMGCCFVGEMQNKSKGFLETFCLPQQVTEPENKSKAAAGKEGEGENAAAVSGCFQLGQSQSSLIYN